MYLLSGSSNQSLTENISRITGIPLLERDIKTFMDGETKILIRNPSTLQKKHITIIQTITNSAHLIELCLLVDSLKSSGISKISLIAPYLFYSRQDKPKPGEPFSPHVIIKIIESSGIADITFIDLHSKKVEELFTIPTKKLSTISLLTNIINKESVIVAPDKGGVERAEETAHYFNTSLVHITKERLEHGKVLSKLEEKEIHNKDCFIVDDIIDSGNTICEAAKTLKIHGARTVNSFCTHGILSKNALPNLKDSELDHLFITNSINMPQEIKDFDKISIIDLAPLISKTLK